MKNHAFLILAHNQPELLSRIVSVLMAPHHYFFIHVDAKCEDFQGFRDAINRIGGGQCPIRQSHRLLPLRSKSRVCRDSVAKYKKCCC